MKKEYKSSGVRKYMWFAARSTCEYYFKKNMDIVKKLNAKAYDWLSAKPRGQWSRSGFRDTSKSDMFVNNICEVFNSAIKKYREMGILSMFKGLHLSCMQRIQKRYTKMERMKILKHCPNALKTLNRKCACRRWQLTGLPCHHAIACIFFQKQNPEDYIHSCYERKRFQNLYSNILEPISGEEFWEATNQQTILPPVIKVAPGRPKKKRDKRNDVVQTRKDDPTMLKRTGTSVACTWCQEYGHNSRTCKTKKIDMARKAMEEVGEAGQGERPERRERPDDVETKNK